MRSPALGLTPHEDVSPFTAGPRRFAWLAWMACILGTIVLLSACGDAAGKAESGISRTSGAPVLAAYRPTLYRSINVVARLPLSVVIANWRRGAILSGIASGGLIFLVLAAGVVSHAYVLQREKIME